MTELVPLASTSTSPPTIPTIPRIKRINKQALSESVGTLTSGEEPTASAHGGRLLSEDQDPWSQNAWDKVEWGEEQEMHAKLAVEKQAITKVTAEVAEVLNGDPASFWDAFYSQVKDTFFNDRAWLRTEFPELADAVKIDAGPKRIVEIGCGNGATLFPLLAANENPHLQLHGLDFSKEAVQMVLNNPNFDSKHCHSQVWDLSSNDGIPTSIEEESVDIAIMIFVLSALHPDEWKRAVENTWKLLKPGGILLFRDYGRNDMAQLRFRANRYMQPGLYCRGDMTRVYFFEKDDLVNLWSPSASTSTTTPPSLDSLSLEESTIISPSSDLTSPYQFELLHLGIDRRLLLNRKLKLKMYRIWLQGTWRKPLTSLTPSSGTTQR